ncbi:Syd protein [Klebsiella pneumoniae]|uniref:Syd protein n=1 Tax=Klebsiella pneumoniae TaxID=573 RepID=A0A447RPY8_KLEPN|nr:Syd protein [Klebsiella pneumoniae]
MTIRQQKRYALLPNDIAPSGSSSATACRASEELYGVPSPCVVDTQGEAVFWQPQPFSLAQNISAVERALDIVVQQPLHSYYTTQFAGDMSGRFAGETLTLLQTWSEEDFQRVAGKFNRAPGGAEAVEAVAGRCSSPPSRVNWM